MCLHTAQVGYNDESVQATSTECRMSSCCSGLTDHTTAVHSFLATYHPWILQGFFGTATRRFAREHLQSQCTGSRDRTPLPPFLAEQILSLDGGITLLLHLWVKILLSKNHGNEHHTHAVDIALLSVTTLLHLRRQVRCCPCILRHRMLGIKVARQVEIGQFPLVLPWQQHIFRLYISMCNLVFVKEIQGCQKMLKTISNLKLVWWTINCPPCAGFEIRRKKVIEGARGAEFQHDVKHTLLGIDLMEAHNVLMTIEPLQKSDFIFTQRIFVGVNVFPSKSFLASILLYFLHGSKLPSSKASDDSVVFRDLLGTSTAFRNFAWSWHGENMAGCLKRFSTQLIFGLVPNMFLLGQHTMAFRMRSGIFTHYVLYAYVCVCVSLRSGHTLHNECLKIRLQGIWTPKTGKSPVENKNCKRHLRAFFHQPVRGEASTKMIPMWQLRPAEDLPFGKNN